MANDSALDVDPELLSPVWPIDPSSLVVDNATYQYATIPLSSIAMVTDRVLKVHSIDLAMNQSTFSNILFHREKWKSLSCTSALKT